MAYTPTVWKDGDVVTSARLNKIENAIEAIAETNLLTPLIVEIQEDSETGVKTLNMTWQQIYDAFMSGRKVLGALIDDSVSIYRSVSEIGFSGKGYSVTIYRTMFTCDAASGYPSTESESPSA